jgi:hypothetical protein
MARFVVDHTPDAEHTLAGFLASAPPGVRHQITLACDSIDAKLTYADLLPNYRRRKGAAPSYRLTVFPVLAEYEVDEVLKVVMITHYRLMPRTFRP